MIHTTIAMKIAGKEKGSPLVSKPRSLVCPLCERGRLIPLSHHSARCGACCGSLSGAVLAALREIATLPETVGTHACECGHPQMRCLPDGVFHCPACRSEVLPLGVSAVSRSDETESKHENDNFCPFANREER